MPIAIVPYTAQWVPAVCAFNHRLRDAGAAEAHEQFPETPDPGWLPDMELFLAVDGSAVRGGYMLRRHKFWFYGQAHDAAHYRLPLSEGLIDRAYATLALRLVRDALVREKKLYALGMGGRNNPLPRMLERLGWRICETPFYFKVVNGYRFLRQIRALRTTPLRRLALDAAALCGAGWFLGVARRVPERKYKLAPEFASWADEIWDRSASAYGMLATRDAPMLEEFYAAPDGRFLRVRTGAGWAVALDTAMRGHKRFGDMRVGTIVDALAPLGEAPAVIQAVTHLLVKRGVDIVISNQLHTAWAGALRAAGFRAGPSNFLLALSPALATIAGATPECEFHINRGDGDGPVGL